MTIDKTLRSKPTSEIILKSGPKFEIYGLLLVYPELTLKQLSTLLNKAKSTIHEHLTDLIDAEIVSVVKTEKIRSNRERNYYGLSQDIPHKENFEESDLNPVHGTEMEKETYCREVLKVYESFTYQQIFE